MVRNIIAVIIGAIVGSSLNIAIITIGPMIISNPPGTDMTTAEGLAAAMPLLEPKHFIAPFLAHSLQSLVGAAVAAAISATHKMTVAMVVGCLSLVGGILAAAMIPAPLWFEAADLLLAYIPMAYLGGKIGSMMRSS